MLKILLIEDEPAIREEVLEWLNFEHFEALGAKDGIEGVAMALLHRPDLILCDLMMPNLDGFGVVRRLRADPVTENIPVILVSARTERNIIQDGAAAGACGYVTKPFSYEELHRAMHHCLEQRSQ